MPLLPVSMLYLTSSLFCLLLLPSFVMILNLMLCKLLDIIFTMSLSVSSSKLCHLSSMCHGFVSLSCTQLVELKTLTLSAGMYIIIYLIPPTHRQGNKGRNSLVIDTLTKDRKRCKQRTQWERSFMETERTLE